MNEETQRAYKNFFDRPISDPKLYRNRAEEERILAQVLEGTLQPRNDWEREYLAWMGGISPKPSRPRRRVTCVSCGVEWEAICHWSWPTVCQACADRMDARALGQKAKPPPLSSGDGHWDPYKDEPR